MPDSEEKNNNATSIRKYSQERVLKPVSSFPPAIEMVVQRPVIFTEFGRRPECPVVSDFVCKDTA